MKTIAYTALHYGVDYLGDAIDSIIEEVDAYYVLYSPVGSHGHQTVHPCPESKGQLFEIALKHAGDKLRWIDGKWAHEGMQRDTIFKIAPEAGTVVVLDADEVWQAGILPRILADSPTVRNVRVPMWHYWRSLRRAIVNDPAYPIRLIYPAFSGGEITVQPGGHIDHLGYAQNSRIVEYKQYTHGHRAEWRQDWFRDRWIPNAQEDVHPTNLNYWYPVSVDVPERLRNHPYAKMEVIP